MATKKQDGGELGFKKTYKMTGTASGYAGGPGETTIDKGASGSHRDNNWKVGAAQAKLSKPSKVGPDKNLNEIGGGNFY
jgi:hypothetical protein